MFLKLLLLCGVPLVVTGQWPQKCNTSASGYSSWNETRCPASQSCAPNGFSVSGMGCCPWPNGVTCGDYSCCPSGTTCIHESGSGYGEVFQCASGGANQTRSKCPCKPGMRLPMSTTLKNVLIIGDSLSIGYTPYVANLLEDVALVQHAPWDVSVFWRRKPLITSRQLTSTSLALSSPSNSAGDRRRRRGSELLAPVPR
jgi:hypothetical protein